MSNQPQSLETPAWTKRPCRVAFVHDWLVTWRGGEKVLAALLELFPEAPIYTLFYEPAAMPRCITQRNVQVPALLNRLRRIRKAMLPALPRLIESFDLAAFDLIISTSSCVAKGAVGGPHTRHLCYIHSPMRYIWDQKDEYLASVAHIPGARLAIESMIPALRRWDVQSAKRVTKFVANSSFVAQRVKQYYDREATVVHPPIAIDQFSPLARKEDNRPYFLAAGAFVSYKRFDLAIEACLSAGRRLIVAGSGPEEQHLRKRAQTGGNAHLVEFVIEPDDKHFRELLAGAEALLFPGVEDFGMIAVEAMACGTPVIAFERGGAIDFIRPNATGVFFNEASPAALASVLRGFRRSDFSTTTLVDWAKSFGKEVFLDKMRREINDLL